MLPNVNPDHLRNRQTSTYFLRSKTCPKPFLDPLRKRGRDITEVRLIRRPWCRSRIPPEIVCEIFHYCVLSFQSSAWIVSQVWCVCRRIALECSTLWDTIGIPSYYQMRTEVVILLVSSGSVSAERHSKDERSRAADQLGAPRFTNAQVLHTEGVEYLIGGS